MSLTATLPSPAAVVVARAKPSSAPVSTKQTPLPPRPTVLIVSDRPAVVEKLRTLLRSYKFNVGICSDPKNAGGVFNRMKLDGILLDWSPEHSLEVVAKIRSSASNRRSIVCAVADDSRQLRAAFTSGCNFVVDQPLVSANLQRLLRVMNGLIVKEHRRYFRGTERVSVALQSQENDFIECLNLSETGIALQMHQSVEMNATLKLRIDLFDGKTPVQIDAQVRRMGHDRMVGLTFTKVPVSVLSRIQNWIDQQIMAAEKHFGKQNYAFA